jgi:hypothetical protein
VIRGEKAGLVMDAYIVQIYRRDATTQSLHGRVEHVSKGVSRSFASPQELWEFFLQTGNGAQLNGPKKTRSAKMTKRRSSP